VRKALACLGDRYPDGLDWLEGRLNDVNAGRAEMWRGGIGRRAWGYAIVTPKGRRHLKLSTFYIAPAVRGRGLGRQLFTALADDWLTRGIDEAWVTVDESDRSTCAFFQATGFAPLPAGRCAYGQRFDRAYTFTVGALSLTGRPVPPMVYPS
jgi:ribosomal protein S18 acetylase RimI-like enzyme